MQSIWPESPEPSYSTVTWSMRAAARAAKTVALFCARVSSAGLADCVELGSVMTVSLLLVVGGWAVLKRRRPRTRRMRGPRLRACASVGGGAVQRMGGMLIVSEKRREI